MGDSGEVPEVMFNLPIRTYRIGRLYGPGMPASCEEGFHYETLEKPISQVGLVSVHCWNLGEEGGPYPIEPGSRHPGEVADWVPRAHDIIAHKIKPVLTAAREAGIRVFHLGQYVYAPRYEQYLRISADPGLQDPHSAVVVEGCVRPWTVEEHMLNQYGPDFPGPVWKTHADQFDIAEAARPEGDEPVVLTGFQLNGLCRREDIDTLIYIGFMADLCLMNIPAAMREMFTRFGYRCIVLRDCTTAYEYADTYEAQCMNRAAVRLMETDLGSSSTAEEFIHAAQDAR
jgi:nicotinamidase-related amidase